MSNGAFIFIAIVILLIFAIGWTSFGRRRGSGIGSHPVGDGHAAPGSTSPSERDHDHTERRPADFGTK